MKPTRPDATEAPQEKEKATHTRRNRHDHNRKQDVVNSSGCGISSCEVGSDLARPGNIFVRGEFAPGKDAPGHRAQSPKLRTARDEFS